MAEEPATPADTELRDSQGADTSREGSWSPHEYLIEQPLHVKQHQGDEASVAADSALPTAETAMCTAPALMEYEGDRQRTRELLVWEVGLYSALLAVVTLRTLATRHFYPPVAIPLVLMPYGMAYQVDMAYGNKFDRVKAEADRILAEEAHWFTDVPKADEKKKIMF